MSNRTPATAILHAFRSPGPWIDINKLIYEHVGNCSRAFPHDRDRCTERKELLLTKLFPRCQASYAMATPDSASGGHGNGQRLTAGSGRHWPVSDLFVASLAGVR